MIYKSTTYISGSTHIGLKYTNEALDDLIGKIVTERSEFSYSQLCSQILSVADEQGMLKKEPNTIYSHILLTRDDLIRITKNLWKRIWAKEILLLFNDPQDLYHRDNETYFIVCKQ